MYTCTHAYTHYVWKITGSSCNPLPSPWQPSRSPQFMLPYLEGCKLLLGRSVLWSARHLLLKVLPPPPWRDMPLSKVNCFSPVPKGLFLFCSFYWGWGGSTSDEKGKAKGRKGRDMLTSRPSLTVTLEGKSEMHKSDRNKQYMVSESN